MKKIVVLVIVMLLVGFAVRMSGASENSGIAVLDSQTFVMTDGRAVYLLEIENGKVILKDSVLVYSVQDRQVSQFDADKAVSKRLRLETK
jgi:hypothetical protein